MIILDEPDLTELKVVIDEITSDLSNDNIDMDDIVIIADGGEVLNNVLRVSSPHWPKSFHVQIKNTQKEDCHLIRLRKT